jgi:hypothetical protein
MEKNDFIVGEEEIIELTGFVNPSKQRESLDRMGVRYFVRKDGHIRTTRAWFTQFEQHVQKQDDGFDLDALK